MEGWNDEEAETFRVCIRAMDNAFHAHMAKERDDAAIPNEKKRRVVGEMTPERFDAMFG